jgi:hypothetical protein
VPAYSLVAYDRVQKSVIGWPATITASRLIRVDDLYVVRFDVAGGLLLDSFNNDGAEPEEDIEPDVKTTFAQFGSAYYQANVLEHEIVNILAMAKIVEARSDAEQLLSDPWDDKFKATLGKLVKELGPYIEVDPELAADIENALRLRNMLAHAFWRERAEDFCTDAGRSRMIADLIEMRNHFQDVNDRLSVGVGSAKFQQWGVTPAIVEQWYQEQLALIERGELTLPRSTVDSARDELLSRLTRTA